MGMFHEIVTIQLIIGDPPFMENPSIIAPCVLVILGGSTADYFIVDPVLLGWSISVF